MPACMRSARASSTSSDLTCPATWAFTCCPSWSAVPGACPSATPTSWTSARRRPWRKPDVTGHHAGHCPWQPPQTVGPRREEAMSQDAAGPTAATQVEATDHAEVRRPLIIATVARERGITGVHTHVRQLRRFLERAGEPAELVTPHSWARGARLRAVALVPLFGARIVLERVY